MRIKKIISLLIALIISVSIFTLPAFADTTANSSDFTIENGVLTAYNGTGGDVTIPNSVTSIGYMAFALTRITSITIPSSVKIIGADAFDGCLMLTSVTISSGVTDIGAEAFVNCLSLTSITIPNSVTSIGDCAFDDCESLTNFSVDVNNPNYSSENGILFSKDKTKFIQYPVGIAQTTYAIPSSVTSVGNSAFDGCKRLTSVTIPNSVSNIGRYAFFGTSLTSVTIPSSVTGIGDGLFADCESLINISVDDNNPNYSSENGILFSKDKTKFIQYPAGITQTAYTIPSSVTSVGDSAFDGCKRLTSVIIPSSISSISDSMFCNCGGLTSVIIPNSVKSIGDYAFAETHLTSVTIPNSVTSIGKCVFAFCPCLTLIAIPSSVTRIGDGAFSYCMSLTSVTIPNSVTSIGINVFSDCNDKLIIYGLKDSSAQTYAKVNNINFSIIVYPSFGTVEYSTTVLTNRNVTVTIPVNDATVTSVTHVFNSNGNYTFTVTDKAGNKATKTVTVSNIDKVKPIIKANISDGKRSKGKVTVRVSDANLKSKSVKLNGKAISWTKNNTFTKKGSYVITASDKAGNTSKFTFSIVK